jgi:hypothetical protein
MFNNKKINFNKKYNKFTCLVFYFLQFIHFRLMELFKHNITEYIDRTNIS